MHHSSKPTLPAARLALAAALLAACAPLPEDSATSAAPVILCGAASPSPTSRCAPVCDATCGACPPGAPPNGYACDPSPPGTVPEGSFILPHPRGLPPWSWELWRTEWYGNLGVGAPRAPPFTTNPPPDPS